MHRSHRNRRAAALLSTTVLVSGLAAVGASPAAAATHACSPGQTLRKGQKNSSCVKDLQLWMRAYLNRGIGIDGDFGDETLAAVKDIQGLKPKITQDGVVGPHTRDKVCLTFSFGIPAAGRPDSWLKAGGDAWLDMCLGWGYHYN